jgi:LysM repeat protein
MSDMPSGALQKAYLQLIRPGGGTGAPLKRVTFQFNPKEYSVQKSASWVSKPGKGNKKPTTEYNGPEPRSMTVEAFLDATGSRDAKGGNLMTDIETLFDCLAPLPETVQNDKPSPPFVQFGWGDVRFEAFVKQVSVKYTLFDPSGTPIRATVSLTLQETSTPPSKQNPTSGALASLRTHTVVAGDSLQSIAYAEYKDARLWRALAHTNRLDDPMRLRAGTSLLVPSPEDAAAYA